MARDFPKLIEVFNLKFLNFLPLKHLCKAFFALLKLMIEVNELLHCNNLLK